MIVCAEMNAWATSYISLVFLCIGFFTITKIFIMDLHVRLEMIKTWVQVAVTNPQTSKCRKAKVWELVTYT